MNTDVQYTMTADGVRIAYGVSGSGPVLIAMPDIGFSSTLLAERDLPEVAAWAEALSEHFTYVRYDARGYGVSQHDVPDISISTWALDLDAVAHAVHATGYVLFGYMGAARISIGYANEHPETVGRLIAWPADLPITTSPEGEMLLPIARQDWESFTEILAHIALGWHEGTRANRLAAFWREVTPHTLYLQYLEQFQWPADQDLRDHSARLEIPCLILARRHKYSAARISAIDDNPNVRLRMLPGDETMPYDGDTELVIQNMVAFVAAGMVAETSSAEPASDAPGRSLRRRGPTPSRMLSTRELEVLKLLADAKSNGEIAEELVLSVRTVERHLMRIYDKLGATGKSARVVAAAYAALQDISPP